ncbi:MAG TPA: CCA tRNA nucleotidyltransferase [Terracidiphilus sp.]|jgi:poly(A) polymerase
MEAAMLRGTGQFDAALGVVERLRAAGYEAYLAGGCVRDLLLGREPKDFDVATSATPEVVLGLFERTFAVGAHFGVVLVATCGGADAACAGTRGAADAAYAAGAELAGPGYVVTEVATFRSDGAYSDGRHPDAVRYTRRAEEDVRRRDFTINGLLLDPEKLFPQGLKPPSLAGPDVRAEARTLQSEMLTSVAKAPSAFDGVDAGTEAPAYRSGLLTDPDLRSAVIDFVGGVEDLDAGVVRAIGRAEERFLEDHLRLLRGVRFAARFGFELEAGTRAAMQGLAGRIQAVSRERVRDELTKMLTEGRARRAFELLEETGLLKEVLPEVARMKGVEQPAQYHPEGDVWVHTLGLLGQLEAECAATLAWGALLHDVGKAPTFRRAPDRIRFDGHVEVGVAMGTEICRRFRFSNEETRQIVSLIENHMRFADAERMKASTLKRFFRLEGFEEHLALHRMDCLAGSGSLEHWEFVHERWLAMPEETVRPRPLITGRELIAAGYEPGAAFKEMLRAVEDAQLEGTIGTTDEALRLVREQFPAPGCYRSGPKQ